MFYKEMKNENNLIKAYKLLAEIEAIIDNIDSNSQEYLDFMDEMNRISVK